MVCDPIPDRGGETMTNWMLERLRGIPPWKYIILVEVIYLIISFSLFLSWPLFWPDEVHFADVARTFSEHGYLGTDLIKGMETHVYWQPPLYFIVSAAVIAIGGFDIGVLRFLSILIGCGILLLIFLLGTRVMEDSLVPKVGMLLLALNPNFVDYVKLARMDGLCVFFLLLVVLLFVRWLQGGGIRTVLASGVFLALAVLTHVMGFIGAIGIVLYLFLFGRRPRIVRVKQLGIILLPLAVALGLWGVYVFQDPGSFLRQMEYQFLRKSPVSQFSWVHFIERYRTIPLFLPVLIAGTVYLWRRAVGEKSETLCFLTVMLLASFLIVGFSFELPYHLYYLPYGSLAISVLLTAALKSSRSVHKSGSFIAGGILMANFLMYFAYFNFTLHVVLPRETDYKEFTTQIANVLPLQTKVFLYGYPSAFWGLRPKHKGLSFVEGVFLDQEKAGDVITGVDYVIFTRAFDPRKDDRDFNQQRMFIDSLCVARNCILTPVGAVGTKRWLAYSAEVLKLVPCGQPCPQSLSR
jgi:4-amino-4-deoxy-L-arabinose transferase-like glycosyltransferase